MRKENSVQSQTNVCRSTHLSGIHSPIAVRWFMAYLNQFGITADQSPAEWPEPVWRVYLALRGFDPADRDSASAASLLARLGIGSQQLGTKALKP